MSVSRLLRAAAGLVAAVLLASVPAMLTLIATQGMTGRESAVGIVALYVVRWLLLFALGSSVGLAIAGVEGKQRGKGIIAFAGGGAVAGLLVACLLLTHHLGGSPQAVFIGFAIPLVLPWVIGGAILALTL